MRAIRLTKENRQKILQESPIEESKLDAMLKEYDTPYINTALFFVPQHDLAHSLDENSWMTIPWKFLSEKFNYDRDKINHEFIVIDPK